MNLDNILYDRQTMAALESFHQVWGRVSGPALPAQNDDLLPELLTLLHKLHRHYRTLCESFSGEHRSILRKMTQETLLDYRRLQAAFYIREGKLFSPVPAHLPKGKRPLLRSAILLESSLTECARSDHSELAAPAEARKEKATMLLIACI